MLETFNLLAFMTLLKSHKGTWRQCTSVGENEETTPFQLNHCLTICLDLYFDVLRKEMSHTTHCILDTLIMLLARLSQLLKIMFKGLSWDGEIVNVMFYGDAGSRKPMQTKQSCFTWKRRSISRGSPDIDTDFASLDDLLRKRNIYQDLIRSASIYPVNTISL